MERKRNKLSDLDKIKGDKERLKYAEDERQQLNLQYEKVVKEISLLRSDFIKEVIGSDTNVKDRGIYFFAFSGLYDTFRSSSGKNEIILANDSGVISQIAVLMRPEQLFLSSSSRISHINFLNFRDDLDNKLVYDLIVTRLKKTKSNRQIIVVTHNANIPGL